MVVPIADDGSGLLHLLEVDGANWGPVPSVGGGWGIADVIEEPSPTGVKKRPGPPRWGELELRLALPVARPVFDWIASSWKGDVRARNLVVTTVDLGGKVLRRREFRDAFLAAATIPTLDSSPDMDLLALRFVSQAARTTMPSGTVPLPTRPRLGPLFPRLELPGLDCTHVGRIDEFTVRQAFGSVSGDLRAGLEPGLLSFPNLTVTLGSTSATFATDWQQWFENFVVRGYHDDANEKTGTLTLVDQQQRAVVRIGLFNVGIFRLTGPTYEVYSSVEGPRLMTQVVAGLYCERMEFTLP